MNNALPNTNNDLYTSILSPDSPLRDPNRQNNSIWNSPNRPSLAVRHHMINEIRMNIYGSIAFCVTFIAVSIVKIGISSFVLSYQEPSCNQPLEDFLAYMIIHDACFIPILVFRLVTVMKAYGSVHPDRRDLEDGTRSLGTIEEEHFATHHEQLAAFKWKLRIIIVLTFLLNIYYCAIFIYAQFLYFDPVSNCSEVSPVKNGLVLAYICFGYLFIGIPTIFVLLSCFCLPFVLLGIHFIKRRQMAASRKLIDKLPVKKYTPDLPGDNECSICMAEYKLQENIVQLKCSKLHYFHEACIKKWLVINGHCPICRKRIDEEERIEMRAREPAP